MHTSATKLTNGALASEPQGTRRDLSDYLRLAMTRLGIQKKEIELCWGTGHAYVSRVLSNEDPLPDYRIAQLPDVLQCALIEEWARDYGLTVGRKAELGKALEALAALVTDDRLAVPFKMAKMDPER